MTHEEVKALVEEMGLPYAYDHFAEGESPDPPFICFLYPRAENFGADNLVYHHFNRLDILGIVDRIIRLIARLPLTAVLTADDCLWQIVSVLILTKFKPFMLNDTGPRSFTVGIVHCCIALEVWFIQSFRFKADGTVFQRAQLVVKVGINRSSVYNLISQCVQLSFVLQIVCVQTNLNAIQQIGNHLGIASSRNTLIKRVEVVIIKSQPNRKTLDNKGRQLFTVTSPLLLSVALNKFLVDITTDKRNGLLFEILRLSDNLLALLFNLCGGLLRCHNTPHLVKSVHIERQRIELTFIINLY